MKKLHFHIMKVMILFFAFFLLIGSTVQAQEIIDEADGEDAVDPGPESILIENCTVSIFNRVTFPQYDGSFSIPNVPADGTMVRARVTCPRADGETFFAESDLFSPIASSQTPIEDMFLDKFISPIVDFLVLTPSKLSLTSLGDTAQLTVTGTFDDGTTADVTNEPDTVYTTSNPNIASVDGTGLVTAVSSGTVVLSASKDGVLSTLIMTVSTGTAGDSDGDGIPDDYETANGLNPNDPLDAALDPDGDGLTNLQEFQTGTDPNVADTDGDGISDGVEVAGTNGFVTNPLLSDTDGDGIRDLLEIQTGTDPTDPNSFNLAQALSSIDVTPPSFNLTFNTVLNQSVSQQLDVTGHLTDGNTIDLTSTTKGTSYTSSDLLICNFGSTDGEIFAGQDGTCTITVTNNGFTDLATATVVTFSPMALSFVTIPGFANNVDIGEGYAYVAAGATGLQVVDVSDRSSPSIVASLDTPGNANDVKVTGNTVYIADGSSGLQIVDVSNPTLPSLLGSYDTSGEAWNVAVSGNQVFVADGVSGLQIIDVSDPAAPTLLGSVDSSDTAKGVDVNESLAILADGLNGAQVIGIINLTNPEILGSVDTIGNASDVEMVFPVAYLADRSGSLQIIDMTDPTLPSIVGSTDQNTGGVLVDIAISGNLALVADKGFLNTIVPLIDVSDSGNPIVRDNLSFAQFRNDDRTGIAVDSQFVYVTASVPPGVENGISGDTRLYIGQYVSFVDLAGVSPMVDISSPAPGDSFIEGETITIRVDATDDIQVVSVDFVVDGQVVFTDTTAPYEFSITIPDGVGSLTIGASAVDPGGNVGLANDVQINVTLDPRTTVVGTVVDEDGIPIAGATVRTIRGLSGTTISDGTFSILGVSTVVGDIRVDGAFTDTNGFVFSGFSANVSPVPGGTTDVSVIVLRTCLTQPNGILGWWPGDGDTNDLVGINNGTFRNGALFDIGIVDQAFHFTGEASTSNYVEIPGFSDLTNAITVTVWFKFQELIPDQETRTIVAKADTNGGTAGWTLQLKETINFLPRIRFILNDDNGGRSNVASVDQLNVDTWYFVAATYDGTTQKIFVDGVLVNSVANSGSILSAASELLIGRSDDLHTGGPRFFNGLVDEVSIFDRALTDQEIQDIFDAGSEGICKP